MGTTNGSFQATTEQLKALHESAQSEIAKAQEEILKREVTLKTLNETLENEKDAHQTTKREHALTKAAHEKLQNEISQMHDQWRLHEEQLKQSTSQIQGQLESLHMDAGNKGQKIGELQRESMTFKSM